ncbi:hypothetical protein [Sphingobacterium tenebrionis]|uniref:hypothetical protein n=1 Tax=Sphingobacterium tenebrionis TaxID=3111775 RepID=UPI003F58DACC
MSESRVTKIYSLSFSESLVTSCTQKLKSGAISPDAVAPIRIVEKGGLIYTLDNRGLKAFQDAGLPVNYQKLNAIPIK